MKASAKPLKAPKARGQEALRAAIARLERELQAVRLRRARANLDILRLVEFNNQVLGNLSSGLIAVDARGRVTLINHAAAELLGANLKAAKGQPLTRLLARCGEGSRSLVAALQGKSETLRGEAVLRGEGGERLVSYSLSAFGLGPSGEPEGRALLLGDLTRVREQEARAARQEQLARVGRLSADIAHQIKNPLAGIQGLLQVSLSMPEAPEKLRQNLEMVLGEVRKLDRLVADTLSFTRPVGLAPQELPINQVLLEGLSLVLPAAGLDAPVKTRQRLALPSPKVVADRDQLREVVVNLVKNALEAMPRGGSLAVETRLLRGSRPQAVMVLRDSGQGIPPKVAPHIFDPFFTTKSGGSGLGLPACRRVIDALGGSIRFTTRPGSGTTFTVTLPAVR